MSIKRVYLLLALIAFALPLVPFPTTSQPVRDSAALVEWPQQFEGKPLRRLPLSDRENRFLNGFPGKVARFSDGSRELIVRWVTNPTRKLHSAIDCYRALDFKITPAPIRPDANGLLWSSFVATSAGHDVTVYERIFDDHGNSWIHVSGWYWSAISGRSQGPWWAITVASEG